MKKIISGVLAMVLVSSVGFAEPNNKGLWENLEGIKDGQKIQVIQTGSLPTAGKFRAFSGEGISLEVEKKLIVIKRSDVQRVDLRKGRGAHILAAAGIGAAAGLVTTAAMGRVEGGWTAIFIPIFAGGGAGVGAVLPTRSVIYRASKQQSRLYVAPVLAGRNRGVRFSMSF